MGMMRSREDPFAVKAGALSLLVHGLLLMLLVVSFSWHNVAQPLQVAQVELWDSLPTPQMAPPPPEPPKPEPKAAAPEPEPPPPPPEPKAEIQVKAKPPVEIKPKPEKKPEQKPKLTPKPDPALKAREDIKRLQQLMAEEDQQLQKDVQQKDAQQVTEARSAAEANRAASTSGGVVSEYKAKIQAKIKRYVNKQVCGSGKPALEFGISLLPTGEIAGNPRLTRSSGIPACDQAVERAILQAQPLPLPPQPELFAQFRDLNLQFRPNEE